MVQKSDRFQQLPTTRNNIQQGVQADAKHSTMLGLLANNVASFRAGLKGSYLTLVTQNIFRLINKLEADGAIISLPPPPDPPPQPSLSLSIGAPFKGT